MEIYDISLLMVPRASVMRSAFYMKHNNNNNIHRLVERMCGLRNAYVMCDRMCDMCEFWWLDVGSRGMRDIRGAGGDFSRRVTLGFEWYTRCGRIGFQCRKV